jgi:hypothetical protein
MGISFYVFKASHTCAANYKCYSSYSEKTNSNETPWSRVLLEKLIMAKPVRNFLPFLDPICSLPCW